MRMQSCKPRIGKEIVVVIGKETGESVRINIVRAPKINGLEPDVMRKAIVPKIKGKLAQEMRFSTSHVVDISDCRNIITKNKKRNRRKTFKEGSNPEKNS